MNPTARPQLRIRGIRVDECVNNKRQDGESGEWKDGVMKVQPHYLSIVLSGRQDRVVIVVHLVSWGFVIRFQICASTSEARNCWPCFAGVLS